MRSAAANPTRRGADDYGDEFWTLIPPTVDDFGNEVGPGWARIREQQWATAVGRLPSNQAARSEEARTERTAI